MNPKHKNFENLKKFLEETQDVQGFMIQVQQYFEKQQDNKENVQESMEIDLTT